MQIQQAETGLFAEYSPDHFSLAPTGFGIMHVSRTLELLDARGAPAIDPEIVEEMIAAQRKAIVTMLTSDKPLHLGKGYSNQWSGALRAAAAFLAGHPDDGQMRAAFLPAVGRAAREFQSPADFLYEAFGTDVGYSTVHERNVRRVEGRREVESLSRLLTHPEARRARLFANGGVNTRTSASIRQPRMRPTAAHAKRSRRIGRR